jgi:hypothetical protein
MALAKTPTASLQNTQLFYFVLTQLISIIYKYYYAMENTNIISKMNMIHIPHNVIVLQSHTLWMFKCFSLKTTKTQLAYMNC